MRERREQGKVRCTYHMYIYLGRKVQKGLSSSHQPRTIPCLGIVLLYPVKGGSVTWQKRWKVPPLSFLEKQERNVQSWLMSRAQAVQAVKSLFSLAASGLGDYDP